MDKKTLMFGRSGRFATGLISNYPSSVFKTAGLNGILQPYQIYISELSRDGPYVERTKLTDDDQDPTQYSKRMTTTEYIKGHGEVTEVKDTSKLQPSRKEVEIRDTVTQAAPSTSKQLGTEQEHEQTIKISEVQFKRKVSEHLERQEDEKKKKKAKHSFNLY